MGRRAKIHDEIPVERSRPGQNGETIRYKEKVRRDQRIMELVRQNIPMTTAAACTGVARSTLYLWIKRGEEATSGRYRDFCDDLDEARAHAEASLILQVVTHARKDWRAAAWMLERRNPEQWSKPDRLEVSGKNGAAIEVAQQTTHQLDLSALTNEQLAILAYGPPDPDALALPPPPPPDPDTIDADDILDAEEDDLP